MEATDPVIKAMRLDRGLMTKIAKRLGITRSAVNQWQRVPAGHVHRLSKIMEMHPHSIRPDIFPPPRKRKQRAQSRPAK